MRNEFGSGAPQTSTRSLPGSGPASPTGKASSKYTHLRSYTDERTRTP